MLSVPLGQELRNITVLVDENGYRKGENAALAMHAFEQGLPGAFVEGSWTGKFSLDSLAVFNCPVDAVHFMRKSLRHLSAVHFKIMVSGKNAKALLNGIEEHCAGSPCEIMVFCMATGYWREQLKNHRVAVTALLTEPRAFVEHLVFTDDGTAVPFASSCHGVPEGTDVTFCWKELDGGAVQYGHAAYDKGYFRYDSHSERHCVGSGIKLPLLPAPKSVLVSEGGAALFAAATGPQSGAGGGSCSSSSSSGGGDGGGGGWLLMFDLGVLQTGCPAGVNPAAKELHLSDVDFLSLFGMDKCSWGKLPPWQRQNKKQQHRLF
jgi:hypothetical protein